MGGFSSVLIVVPRLAGQKTCSCVRFARKTCRRS